MTLPQRLLPYGQRALIQLLRVAVLSLPPRAEGQIVESLSHSRLAHTADLVEPLHLFVTALDREQGRQIVKCRGHVGVAQAQRLPPDDQSTLEEVFCLPILALVSIHER